jgi:hypothetical protein
LKSSGPGWLWRPLPLSPWGRMGVLARPFQGTLLRARTSTGRSWARSAASMASLLSPVPAPSNALAGSTLRTGPVSSDACDNPEDGHDDERTALFPFSHAGSSYTCDDVRTSATLVMDWTRPLSSALGVRVGIRADEPGIGDFGLRIRVRARGSARGWRVGSEITTAREWTRTPPPPSPDSLPGNAAENLSTGRA